MQALVTPQLDACVACDSTFVTVRTSCRGQFPNIDEAVHAPNITAPIANLTSAAPTTVAPVTTSSSSSAAISATSATPVISVAPSVVAVVDNSAAPSHVMLPLTAGLLAAVAVAHTLSGL